MRKGRADNPQSYGEVGTDSTKENDQDVQDALNPKTPEEKELLKNPLQEQIDYQKSLTVASETPQPQPTSEPTPQSEPQLTPPISELERIKRLLTQNDKQ